MVVAAEGLDDTVGADHVETDLKLRVIGRSSVQYADGAEDELLAIVEAATDISSTSDELSEQARTWAQTYHLDTARANVLRAFDLPADAHVLEIGAGCGAVSRYLGEQCDRVDALEPMPDRAKVAAARTRDLSSVQVLIGDLTDLPPTPTYDVVVVIGVLEYVGDGTAGDPAYRTFLSEIAVRLKPGGTLLLAIENKLGVKYLAGAPEDHTGRPFESVEDYPTTTGVRTFTRTELTNLMHQAGLTCSVLGAFPDYKLTRVVLSPDGLPSALVEQLPQFPSPDQPVVTPRVFDEAAAWKSLVAGGLAAQTPNSFVVVAHRGQPADSLWPAERGAVYFSRGRRARYSTVGVVELELGPAAHVVDRRPLVPHAADAQDDPRLSPYREPVYHGVPLLTVLAERGLRQSAPLLAQWRDLVLRTTEQSATTPIDLIPANLLLTSAGELVAYDQEWSSRIADPTSALRRGALLTAQQLVGRSRRDGTLTVREAALLIGRLVGLETPDWLEHTVAEEARFQQRVQAPVRDGQGRPLRFLELIEKSLSLALAGDEEDDVVSPGVDEFADERHNLYASLASAVQAARSAEAERDLLADQLRLASQQVLELSATEAEALVVSHDQQTQLRAQIEALSAQLAELTAAHADIADRHQVAERERSWAFGEIAAMKKTVSWRTTAVLRAVRRRFK